MRKDHWKRQHDIDSHQAAIAELFASAKRSMDASSPMMYRLYLGAAQRLHERCHQLERPGMPEGSRSSSIQAP